MVCMIQGVDDAPVADSSETQRARPARTSSAGGRAGTTNTGADPPESGGRPRRARVSLLWRVLLVNATVFTVAVVALALSPATVSSPIVLRETVILVGGLTAMLLANLFLLRMTLTPLERLLETIRRVEPLRPGPRPAVAGPPEVAELVAAFNSMLGRIEDERRLSATRTLAAQEEERRRVARELHDEVGQMLTAVLLQLERVHADAAPALRAGLREAQDAARASLDAVREISRGLRPELLDDLGLASALRSLARRVTEQTSVPVRHQIDGDLPPLSADVELALYRVAQESLTNVARHAGATSARLRLERGAGRVVLTVADDGEGFADGAGEGSGIGGMRERALQVGAQLDIRSGPDGVAVRLEVPVDEEASPRCP
jgi:two-component system sensor histidine kinase UhpB